MDEDVVRIAGVGQLAVVDGQILEARIGRLHEHIGLVTGRAKYPLNPEHLVADGVAVAERRQYLVDCYRHRIDAGGETMADCQ
jgi:hypothetical protein